MLTDHTCVFQGIRMQNVKKTLEAELLIWIIFNSCSFEYI